MHKIYLAGLFVFLGFSALAQTFTGSGGAIPADGTPAYFSLHTSSLGASVCNSGFGVTRVCFTINHPNAADVEVSLVSPDGTSVILTAGNGGSGNNYSNTCFSDKAEVSVVQGVAPFSGQFKPVQSLGTLNNGQTGYGEWSLLVRDLNPWADNGMFVNWSLTFEADATAPLAFYSSDLPIIIIDTDGQTIPDDPKIQASMKIIDNGPGVRNYITDQPAFEGMIGIEVRGSSSQMFPKKSYGLETWENPGTSIDTSLFGMPSESDWILNANYTDKSFLRNVMAYQVWQNMGHYATRYRFCEVTLNGQYIGIYIFSEKIKRNSQRVDIAKLKPDQNTGDPLTGGYIFKVDKQTGSGGSGWTSAYAPAAGSWQSIFFQYEYPKEEDITVQQKNYIQDYVYDFETALKATNFTDTLNGYRKYAIETTFIDYFLVNEISKNVDGYRLSTFVHKERDSKGGKLRMGPVWDYDIAWHNADYCGGDVTSGWAYQFPCPDDYWQVPFWWNRLLQDPLYKSRLKCRWQYLRQTTLSNQWFDSYIDSIAAQLNEAQVRNFTTWPILGIYVWPNPWPYATTYQGEVEGLKNWVHSRLTWLDVNMPGTCTTTADVNFAETYPLFSFYPNPVSSLLTIEYQTLRKSKVEISLINQQGVQLTAMQTFAETAGEYTQTIDMSAYTAGVYLVRISINGESYSKKVVKTL